MFQLGFQKNWTDEDCENNLKYIQKRDKIKKEYCKNNNYELIEITYKEISKIEKILAEKLGIELKNT